VVCIVTILEAFLEAKRILTGPNIVGVSYSRDRIIVYATSREGIPTTILGFPVDIIITQPFRQLL
jgi:hypothetical protein